MIQEHLSVIEEFYTAFNTKEVDRMIACYHKALVFEDPAFGVLDYDKTCAMWAMLLNRNDSIDIRFQNIWSEDQRGGVNWEARYVFSKTGRNVHNVIKARFKFQDGLIVDHRDSFDFYRWSRMALGVPGMLLGWTGFFHRKVKDECDSMLTRYMNSTKNL